MKKLTLLSVAISSLLVVPFLNAEEKETNYFGYRQNTGLIGYLYDLKPDDFEESEGPLNRARMKVSVNAFYEEFEPLMRKKLRESDFNKYVKAEESAYLKFLNVPIIDAKDAPKEFGSSYIFPEQIVMIYEGEIEKAPKEKFRFAGTFDDLLCVFVNNKLVFYVSYQEDKLRYKPDEISNQREQAGRQGIRHTAYGEYIKLKKGDEIKICIAEIPGGLITGRLQVQMSNVEYEENKFEDP